MEPCAQTDNSEHWASLGTVITQKFTRNNKSVWTLNIFFHSKILHNYNKAMITVYCVKAMCYDSKPLELRTRHQIFLTTLNLPVYHWLQMYFNNDHGQNSLKQLHAVFCMLGIPSCTPVCSQHEYEILQLLFHRHSDLNISRRHFHHVTVG